MRKILFHRNIFILFSSIVICCGIALTADASRLALVIGNADYDHAVFPALSNPVHDARDVARVLEELCFEVMLEQNADRERMLAAIEEFGRRLTESGGLGLFYYSGHGLQDGQRHYLIPLRSGVYEEKELAMKAVDADTIAQQMKLAGNASNVLIFDTCRERLDLEHFGRSEKDLIAMEGPANSVLVFSTSLGQSAFGDSTARNSLYTRHLVQVLQESGGSRDLLESLRTVNRRVTDEAVFYQIDASSWQFLQKKGLPEEVLQTLRHPELYLQDFTQQQFAQLLQELFPPAQYKHYYPLIQSAAEQRQAPWLYTNVTGKIVLSESCPSVAKNMPPLKVEILSALESDEITISAEPPPIVLMALLSRDAPDARYAWSLDSDFGHLEGNTDRPHIRYIPPAQIGADMTGVSITLSVRSGEKEIRREKKLILLADRAQERPNFTQQNIASPSSSETWKWIAGLGTLSGAAATAVISNNINDSSNSSNNDNSISTNSIFSGTFESPHSTESTLLDCQPPSATNEEPSAIMSNMWTQIEIWERSGGAIGGIRRKFTYIQGCCEASGETSLRGTIMGPATLHLTWSQINMECSCEQMECAVIAPAGFQTYETTDNGRTLVGSYDSVLVDFFHRIE